MFISKPVLVGLAAILVIGAVFALRFADPKPLAAESAGTPQLKMAVVNISEVLEKMDARKGREEELENEANKIRALISEMATRGKNIAEALDKMEQDDPDRGKKEQELVGLRAKMELEVKKAQARIIKRRLRDQKELYGIIRDAITKYGRDHGFALVLKTDDRRIGDNPMTQDLQISMRTVLYRGDAVINITDAIIKTLNR